MEKDWVVVYTVNKPYKAEIIKEMLDGNNVPCIVMNQRDSAYGAFGSIEIYVHESHEEKAKDVLKEFKD